MRHIHFAEIGVPVNSLEELHEIYLTYSALDIPFAENFEEDRTEAQNSNLTGWFIQSINVSIETKLVKDGLKISIIHYPIKYSMESLDFAIACQLLMSNQEDELITHLDKYCKEYQ